MSGIQLKVWPRAAMAAAMAALIGTALTAGRAEAYTCKPEIVRSASAVREENALSMARSAWSAAAGNRYGATWQVWDLAELKSQHCTASAGSWTCNAAAKPCH